MAGDSCKAPARARDTRHSIFLAGVIRSLDGRLRDRALCRNLSRHGMKAQCDYAWPTGTRVVCELRGLGEVAARVVWSRNKSIGIRFEHAIEPNRVWEAREPGESERLARYIHLKPASHARPALSLRSRRTAA